VAAPPLRLNPHFSPSFAWLLAFLYAGAAILLVRFAVFSFSYLSIFALILCAFLGWDVWRTFRIHVYQNHAWLSGDLVIRDNVVVLSDNRFATIQTDSLSHPLLVVLRLKLPNLQYKSCVLFFDSLPADDFRRLRVHLRHGMKTEQTHKLKLWFSKMKAWLS
jgi:hypothetical protein